MAGQRSRGFSPGAREVVTALRSIDVQPTKGKGQNFLTSRTVIDQVVDLVDATKDDVVVEVGPGLGALTGPLLERAREVRAIELDERLAAHLEVSMGGGNLVVISGDVLTLDARQFVPAGGEYLFAGSLPYSVGAAIVRRFLELEQPPRRLIVMLQREVAERIAAEPPNMSILGVAVQLYATASVAFHVPPDAFKPRPKVDSSVLVIGPHEAPLVPGVERDMFFELVHAGFHQKRKQLGNTLGAGLSIPKDSSLQLLRAAGIDPQRRAETLSVDEWLKLHQIWRQRNA